MIRLLYVINNLDVGGAERHLLQVLPRLSAHDIQPTVYTIGYKGALAGNFETAGVRVVGAPFADALKKWPRLIGRPLMMLMSALRMLVLMWTMRPDVIHFFLPHAYIMGCLVSLLAPRPLRVMSRRSLNNYQQRYVRTAKLERKLHAVLDAALGNSQRVCDQLKEEGVGERKLGLIYNGLDLSVFETAKEKIAVRDVLGIHPQALVFIIVANLIPYKGHEDLLNALGMVRNDLPAGWRVLCVGRDTGSGKGLKDLAERLGIGENVLFLGERRDVVDLNAASDIGLLISHEEGFSNSILEGMASGLPMVVTDVGGNSEAIENGVVGIVVPSKDPDALAKALVQMANDTATAKEMGIKAENRVRAHFEIGHCVQQYANLYHGLVEEVNAPVRDIIADTATNNRTAN